MSAIHGHDHRADLGVRLSRHGRERDDDLVAILSVLAILLLTVAAFAAHTWLLR